MDGDGRLYERVLMIMLRTLVCSMRHEDEDKQQFIRFNPAIPDEVCEVSSDCVLSAAGQKC